MEITITAKVQIYPSAEQTELLDKTMEIYRQSCNRVSNYIYQSHDLQQRSVNDKLYYELRDRFGMKAQMAQSTIKTVIAKYKTIKENGDEWTCPEFKKPQYDLVFNRDYSLFEDGTFTLNTLAGRVRLRYEPKGMEKYFERRDFYKFGTAKLVKKHGKYFLHIPVTFEAAEHELKDVRNVIGIDRGLNFLVATYDSQGRCGFVRGGFVKQKRAQFKFVRQTLQRRGTSSSRRRLKAIGSRENRWMQDVNHCVSKALVLENPIGTLFVLENLTGIRAATERVLLKDRCVQVSWSYYDLEQKIIYKAHLYGSDVVKVDPHYTSQCCPKCGHVEHGNRDKKTHRFQCKNCDYRSNDDRVAAMNLHRMGINYLFDSQVPSAVPKE